MTPAQSRREAREAFERLLIARHWKNLVVDRVIIHDPSPEPFAIAAAKVFACPAWREQNAALDAMLAEFPGSDGKLPPLPEAPFSSKVRKTRVRRSKTTRAHRVLTND